MAHTKDIPPSVKTIADLIEWLADEHHEGVTSGISRKLGASIATAAFWKRGVVLPNLDYLERIADHYDLPFDQVMEIWRRSRGRRRRGGALGLIIALGLLSPSPSAAAPPGTPHVVQVLDNIAPYKTRWSWWGWFTARQLLSLVPIWSAA